MKFSCTQLSEQIAYMSVKVLEQLAERIEGFPALRVLVTPIELRLHGVMIQFAVLLLLLPLSICDLPRFGWLDPSPAHNFH